VQQHAETVAEDTRQDLLRMYHRVQRQKNFENRLRLDKVTTVRWWYYFLLDTTYTLIPIYYVTPRP